MTLRDHPLRLLMLILIVAFAARVGFASWWQFHRLPAEQRFGFPDSESYWELGQRIATGQPYQFGTPNRRAFRAPGYPLLLAGMFKLTGIDASPFPARMLGACVGTMSVGLVYWCAKPVFGSTAGLCGAALMAVYPGQIATSAFVLAEAPFGVWMLLQLGLWQRSENSLIHSAVLSTISGIVAGLATLTRPSWLLFTPLLIAACRLSGRPNGWRLRSICALLGLALALAPWTVRNWQVYHRFIPTSLQVGASLYDGLNPQANGGSDMRFVERFTAELKAEDAQNPPGETEGAFEVRLDHRMRNAAVAWAGEHPSRALQLAAIKFARTWSPWPNEPSFRRWYVAIPVAISYIAVVALAIAGTWKNRFAGKSVAIYWLPVLYVAILHVVFVGSIRYRQPAMFALAVPAGAALASLFTRNEQRPPDSDNPATCPLFPVP